MNRRYVFAAILIIGVALLTWRWKVNHPTPVTPLPADAAAPAPAPAYAEKAVVEALSGRVDKVEQGVTALTTKVETGFEALGKKLDSFKPTSTAEEDLKKAREALTAKDAEIAALRPRTIEGIRTNSDGFCAALEDLDEVLATSEDRLGKLLEKRKKRLEGRDRLDDHPPAAPGLSRAPGGN